MTIDEQIKYLEEILKWKQEFTKVGIKEFEAILATLRKVKEGGWISVKERYPTLEDADKLGKVLGWDGFEKMAQKCYYRDIEEMRLRFKFWQPLPPSPVTK